MQNFRRTVITTFIFLALLAPFAAGWLHWLQNTALGSAQPQPAGQNLRSASYAPTLAQTTTLGPPSSSTPASAKTIDAPIFLSSDSKTLWLARPFFFDNKLSVELLQRTSNSTTWLGARVSGNRAIIGIPQHAGVVPPPPSSSAKANAFLVFGDSNFTSYSLTENNGFDPLPPRNRVTAALGAPSGVFALSTGPRTPSLSTTENSTPPSPRRAVDALIHRQSPAATSPTTQPVDFFYNAFRNHDRIWEALPPLARLNDPATAQLAPQEGARVALAHQSRRLIALWVNPDAPATLHARSLAYTQPGANWSPLVTSPMPSSFPLDARLTVLALDQVVFLAWPEHATAPADPASPAEILHIRLARLNLAPGSPADLTLAGPGTVLPLGDASKNVSLSRGVAIAASENSIAVVLANKNGDLTGLTLDQQGKILVDPAPVQATSPTRPVPLMQNIALLVLVAMLAISLWQWRQRPMKPAIPQGMQIARVYQRFFAFLIDMGIPLIIVAFLFGISDIDGFKRLLFTWIEGFGNVEAFSKSPEVIYIVGAYLLHVTISELFFGKSIGKVVLGIQVVMLDGKAPTVLAVLLRNVVRIPELLSGILLIYMLISDNRQRLGDLIARTIVVTPKTNLGESD